MKAIIFSITLCIYSISPAQAQSDTASLSLSEEIRMERDNQIKELREKLKVNEEEVKRLKDHLASINNHRTNEKISTLEELQKAVDNKLSILESAPKTKLQHNGLIALTELLNIQKDIKPAKLFVVSQDFFTMLENVGKVQQYNSYASWYAEFSKWYSRQKERGPFVELVNNSINIINNASNSAPLIGSFVQTVSTGISALIQRLSNKDKDLLDKTPDMLRILNIASQFEHQKSIIDHEWKMITKELSQLQEENQQLLEEQFSFFGLDTNDYIREYLLATTEADRDAFKKKCFRAYYDRIQKMEADPQTKDKWRGQVEINMYKVQSLRIRFGQLTMRMFTNIERYEELFRIYADQSKFPEEFTIKINDLDKPLGLIVKTFSETFQPAKYVEDSATMYIER